MVTQQSGDVKRQMFLWGQIGGMVAVPSAGLLAHRLAGCTICRNIIRYAAIQSLTRYTLPTTDRSASMTSDVRRLR